MSTHKFLLNNFLWLTASRLITKVIALFSLPVITYYLSPEDFGIIAMFSVVQIFLSGFLGMGLHSFAGRVIFKYERSNKQECREFLGVILTYLTAFSLFGVFLSSLFIKQLFPLLLGDMQIPQQGFYYVPITMSFLLSIYGFFSDILLNLQLNKRLFYLEMAQFILFLPAEIIGLAFFNFSVWDILILQLFVQIIVLFLGLWLTKDWLSFSLKKLSIFREAMTFSLPMVPLNFAGWVQDRIDKILLSKMISFSAVGIYTAGVQLATQYSFLSRPIATTVKPEISKRLDLNVPSVQNDIRDFFVLFFQFSIFLYFVISLFSQEIVSFFLNIRFHEAYKIIPVFLLSIIFSELSGIFQLKFIFRNETIWFPVTLIISAILNTILNFILIPQYGIYGAAFVKSVTEFIVLLLSYFLSQRLHKSKYNLSQNLLIFLIVIGLVFIINLFHFEFWTGVIIKSGFLFVYIVILDQALKRYITRYHELRNIFINRMQIVLKKSLSII